MKSRFRPGYRSGGPLAHFFIAVVVGSRETGVFQRFLVVLTTKVAPRAPSPGQTSHGKAAEIEALIQPTLEAMGYGIVRVRLSGNDRQVLQIMAERQSDGGMSLDDCREVSHAVSAILDVDDPLASSYRLEISSPGVDRPLTRLADFQRFAGLEAKLEMALPVAGRKRFTGRLKGIEGEDILLSTDDGDFHLAFRQLTRAKLLMTDELLANATRAAGGTEHQ